MERSNAIRADGKGWLTTCESRKHKTRRLYLHPTVNFNERQTNRRHFALWIRTLKVFLVERLDVLRILSYLLPASHKRIHISRKILGVDVL